MVHCPLGRIGVNIFGNIGKLIVCTNNMFIISFLPDGMYRSVLACLQTLCGRRFKLTDNGWKGTGNGFTKRFGMRGGHGMLCPCGVGYYDNTVRVVRHYHKNGKFGMRKMCWNFPPTFIYYISHRARNHVFIRNTAEDVLSQVGTYSYEISSSLCIVKIP